MRAAKLALAAFGAGVLFDAAAVPIALPHTLSGGLSIWENSAATNRFGAFSGSDVDTINAFLPRFDSSLGTLLSAQLSLASETAHPSRSIYLPDVSGVPIGMDFGALGQDTERSLHGFLDLWAYYDARVSYRADYRLTVDPTNTGLFSSIAAEAAFGSCTHVEDLFGDIGDTNPYCTAGNNGRPLGDYGYDWGTFTGSQLTPFIGTDPLSFLLRLDGSMFGNCDGDDVGDYCRVHLAMDWDWRLSLTYIYEPVVPGGEGPGTPGEPGTPGNPMPVPEPSMILLLGTGLVALAASRRRPRATIARG